MVDLILASKSKVRKKILDESIAKDIEMNFKDEMEELGYL